MEIDSTAVYNAEFSQVVMLKWTEKLYQGLKEDERMQREEEIE